MNATPAFTDASLVMHELILQLQQGFDDFSRQSEERYTQWRARMHDALERWPALLENFKTSMNELPKELRRRDFMKEAVTELERYESVARAFIEEQLANHSPKAALETALVTFLTQIQERTRRMSRQIAALQEHPLMQKSLRGEIILADHAHIQWGRKLGHMFCGLFFLYSFEYSGLPFAVKWGGWAVFMLWVFGLEVARHTHPAVNQWVCKTFRPIMREREKTKINSAIFYMFSMSLVYLLFPRDVSVITMLFIAVGDPLAGIIGVYFGRHKINAHASWEGTLTCFSACIVLSLVAVRWLFLDYSLTSLAALVFAVYAGIVGALAEGSCKRLDDNLVMPLLSAPLLWAGLAFLSKIHTP